MVYTVDQCFLSKYDQFGINEGVNNKLSLIPIAGGKYRALSGIFKISLDKISIIKQFIMNEKVIFS